MSDAPSEILTLFPTRIYRAQIADAALLAEIVAAAEVLSLED